MCHSSLASYLMQKKVNQNRSMWWDAVTAYPNGENAWFYVWLIKNLPNLVWIYINYLFKFTNLVVIGGKYINDVNVFSSNNKEGK